ncbi:Alkaline phosphatase [Mycena venus]|uniref:Alkaline phosphatase n=1 Tax=Mycena venus TaxID=2733690 RepID=A0A8H7CTS2_9AGAR|nr:Alkaline phosphatase [Mycena venus]
MLFVLCLVTIASLVGLSSQRPGVLDEISMLEATNSTLLRYPTDFTQNIVPKAIHSHNDYWRDVPLLTALSFGVASVEADVWLVGETLYVGHEMAALTTDRTFDSLYIQPLLSIIAGQNPKSQFTVNQSSINGVFDTSSTTPLQLLVDMKTDGPSTLPFVLSALQPLRERGYLTTCASNGTCTLGPLVVVGTGNTPLAGIQALSPRDVFFDAPLIALNSTFDITLSPIASTDYEVAVGWSGIGNINGTQLAAIQKYVADAHALGIRARFWDTPGWPIHARNNVWQTLIDNGADWLNADDLEAAATMF